VLRKSPKKRTHGDPANDANDPNGNRNEATGPPAGTVIPSTRAVFTKEPKIKSPSTDVLLSERIFRGTPASKLLAEHPS